MDIKRVNKKINIKVLKKKSSRIFKIWTILITIFITKIYYSRIKSIAKLEIALKKIPREQLLLLFETICQTLFTNKRENF